MGRSLLRGGQLRDTATGGLPRAAEPQPPIAPEHSSLPGPAGYPPSPAAIHHTGFCFAPAESSGPRSTWQLLARQGRAVSHLFSIPQLRSSFNFYPKIPLNHFYLHTSNADAHCPNNFQMLLNEVFQLGNATALQGERRDMENQLNFNL